MSQPLDPKTITANALACRFAAAFVQRDTMRVQLTAERMANDPELAAKFTYALTRLIFDPDIVHTTDDQQAAVDALHAQALTWERLGGETRW